MKMARAVLLGIGLVGVGGLVAADAAAQSLTELARQERERRSQQADGRRTITTETIAAPRPGSSLTVAGVPRPPEPVDEEDAGPEAAETEGETAREAEGREPPVLGDDEAAWRAAFADALEEIARAEARLALSEQELVELNNQLLTRSDIYNREYQLGPMIVAKQAEVDAGRQQVAEANQALERLRTQLRRAGLPAGWGR